MSSITTKPPSQKGPYPFWLGGAAAASAASITHPLDLTKYRLQTATAKQGMFKTIALSARSEGITSLWHGLTATWLRQITYSITRFAVYEEAKARIAPAGTKARPQDLALCAATAGAVAGIVGNPAEIVLVRMCSDLNKPHAERFNYGNCLRGLTRIISEEGGSVLFRGLSMNVLRSMALNVSQLSAYDVFKDLLASSGLFGDEGPVLQTSASFAAGTFATTICTPIDVVKSRVQNAKGNASVLQVVRTVAKEGPATFFRGWTPAWLRLQPQTTLLFLFLEQFKTIIDNRRENKVFGSVAHT